MGGACTAVGRPWGPFPHRCVHPWLWAVTCSLPPPMRDRPASGASREDQVDGRWWAFTHLAPTLLPLRGSSGEGAWGPRSVGGCPRCLVDAEKVPGGLDVPSSVAHSLMLGYGCCVSDCVTGPCGIAHVCTHGTPLPQTPAAAPLVP